jgi:hypothetical protein
VRITSAVAPLRTLPDYEYQLIRESLAT